MIKQAEFPVIGALRDIAAQYRQPSDEQVLDQMLGAFKNKALKTLLLSTGLGAAGGLGVQALRRADADPRDPDKPSYTRGALMGALLGGAAGTAGAIPAGLNGMLGAFNDTPVGQRRPVGWGDILRLMREDAKIQ